MEKLISASFAGNMLLALMSILFIFHILIMVGVIPYDMVWAGKIKNRQHMLRMEFISLLVLGLATLLIMSRMEYLNFISNSAIINGGVWILFFFFILNTLGNLTAKSPIEKYGFGTLTVLMSLCCLVLLIA